MAQPRAYSITTNFNDYTTTNPSDPHPGSKFDTEFTEIKQNLDDLNSNIALLQRDDGKLKNEAVHKDGFDQDSLALIGLSGYTVRGAWAAATAYAVGDIVTRNDSTYLNSTAHTSDTFANDTANWTLLANAAINVTGHEVQYLNGRGEITLTNATWSSGSATINYTTVSGTPAVGQLITEVTTTSFPLTAKVQSVDLGNKVITADTVSTSASSGQKTIELGKAFTTSFTYSSSTDYQVYVANQLVAPSAYSVSGNTLTFDTAPAIGTNNVIVWGGGVAVEAAKTHVTTYRDDALDHRDTAADYATRTLGVVRHFDGATGNVSDTSPSDQSGVYSAKEWAVGTQASTGGSAKDWAIKDNGGVSGSTSDHSAKAWAIGGTGVTDTADKGAAKEWAIGTGRIDDQSSGGYSAKEHATGTTNSEGSAKQWALGGGSFVEATAVEGSNYSAKRYASLAAADRVATAADVVSTNADVVSTNADVVSTAATYDQFDDRFLGAHTTAEREVGASNIGKDHDGDALVTGALYFDTTLGVMKVWNGSLWKQLTPTSTQQTNIDAAVADAVDIGKVAALDTEIGRLGAAAYSDGANAYLALLGTPEMANSTDGDIKVVAGISGEINRYATEYKIQDTAPGSPSEGHLWFDSSSNKVLKAYNGTSWGSVTDGQTEAEVTASSISMAIALG